MNNPSDIEREEPRSQLLAVAGHADSIRGRGIDVEERLQTHSEQTGDYTPRAGPESATA